MKLGENFSVPLMNSEGDYSNCPLLSLGQLLDTLLGFNLSTRYGSRREHLLYKMSVYVVVGSGRGSCHGQRVD